MKRRIRQNAWGNWYGYEGRKKVKDFAKTATHSQEEHARAWVEEREKEIESESRPRYKAGDPIKL